MIIVADSGSTKTHWLSTDRKVDIKTLGLNPLTTPPDVIDEAVHQISESVGEDVTNIFFYGAGCGSLKGKDIIYNILHTHFSSAKITVESDMLGACRAAAGNNPSLVGILGTGSNACFYDGLHIRQRAFSMGYILGDEGSANHLGRLWLKRYLSESVPFDIERMFQESYPLTKEEWIYRIYHEPRANTLLASVAPFLSQHKDNQFVQRIISKSFTEYFEYQIKPLTAFLDRDAKKLRLVGSIADVFHHEINEIAKSFNVIVEKVIPSPIASLAEYHCTTLE